MPDTMVMLKLFGLIILLQDVGTHRFMLSQFSKFFFGEKFSKNLNWVPDLLLCTKKDAFGNKKPAFFGRN